MSVIDDLFNALIEKNAQAAVQNASLTNYQLALKMVNNLTKQLEAPSVHPEAGITQPTKNDLESIDAFIAYLAKNPMVHSGSNKPLVISAVNLKEAPEGYTKYNDQFMVHTDGLVALLRDFVQKAKASGNVYLQELLDRLVSQTEEHKTLATGKVLLPEEKKEEPTTETKPSSQEPGKQRVQVPALIPTGKGIEEQTKQVVNQALHDTQASLDTLTPYSNTTYFLNVSELKKFGDATLRIAQKLPELQNSLGAIEGFSSLIEQNAGAWLASPPTTKVRMGFTFAPHSLEVEAFSTQFADGDRNKALEILAKMQNICLNVNSILRLMKFSPTFVQLLGKDELNSQLELGNAYTRAFSDAMSLLRRFNPNYGTR